jgi:hypothetical protein
MLRLLILPPDSSEEDRTDRKKRPIAYWILSRTVLLGSLKFRLTQVSIALYGPRSAGTTLSGRRPRQLSSYGLHAKCYDSGS